MVDAVDSGIFYVNDPVVDMRESPSNDSKIVSQTIFSEEVRVKEAVGDWVSINTSDGYAGWILSKHLINLKEIYSPDLKISRSKAHLYGGNDTEYGPIISLPYGANLKVLDSTDPRWIKVALVDGSECYIQKGDVIVTPQLSHKRELVAFSKQFLGLPYTWGGRSSFGYDCSGFVQMLYSQIGVNFPRDSKEQILDHHLQVIELDDLTAGDLVFFGKSKQRIMHVGMYIGNGEFIHTTARENKPWLRISRLSEFEWSGHKDAYYPYRTARQVVGVGHSNSESALEVKSELL